MMITILAIVTVIEAGGILLLLRRRPVYVEPLNSQPGRVLPPGVPINRALKSGAQTAEEEPRANLRAPQLGCDPRWRLPVGDPKDRLRELLNDPMPPTSDAEKAVLGAMIFDPEQIPKVMEILVTPRMFSIPRHVLIFQAIRRLYIEIHPIDLVTLRDELAWNGLIDLVGGPLYLMELVESVPNAEHAIDYARLVRGHFSPAGDMNAVQPRLEAIDHRNPRLDPVAAEAALNRHFKSLGLRSLPVVWCRSLNEAWNEVVSRLHDESPAWDAFETRITGGKPWLGPRPLENAPFKRFERALFRAQRSAWTREESFLLNQCPFGTERDLFYPVTPTRSAALTAALLTSARSEDLEDPLPFLTMLEAAEAGLWLFWVRRDDIVALLRPAIRFSGDRLHCDDGPALVWPDGARWHFWQGVRVTEQAVEHPETISVDDIRAETNVEVRRVLIERYGVARYIHDIRAQPTHQDRFGTLFTVFQPDDEPLAIVKVVNSTPEPDGTVKEYFLRVPPDMSTAAEAVAWTFGLREHQYHPKIET